MATETVDQEEVEETTDSTTEEEELEETQEESAQEQESSDEEDKDDKDIDGLLSALRKERESVKELKKELRSIKQDSESESERAAREAAEATESKYKKVLAHSEAKAQLVSMGLSSAPERFLKMLDLEQVHVNEDGEVIGLKDQLTSIKRDFPEVFKKKAPKVDAGEKSPITAESGKSSAELLAERFNG